MKLYHQVITFAVVLLLITVCVHPVIYQVDKVLSNYSELVSNQVVIPV
ncbi:hypothetical protein [Seonamhaeicola sp.]|nr:hypothetical protein [Seonamhaeicola sp.]